MGKAVSVVSGAIIFLFLACPVQAELASIGTAQYYDVSYNLIYDDTAELVWLDYSNSGDTWELASGLLCGAAIRRKGGRGA